MTLPARIGRYQVLGLLGQGAMGIVYRGRDASLERDVALKVMSMGHGDAEARMRFEREAKAAARLQHPNIVTIYELGSHEGAPFMALELLEGVDLQRAIEAGLRPNPKVTLPIVLQLVAGLHHAHENGIVHRDVKPSNVFLPRGRPAKIMDFGVARLAGGMTTAGMVVGTPNYMSPEQVRAGALDGRSDLFSVGLILYELVTGEKAYKADSVVGLLYKIAHEDPDLSLLPRGAEWERLRGVLARSLAREPEDRYADGRAMGADLAQALRDLGGTADWATASDVGLLIRSGPQLAIPAMQAAAIPAVPPPAAPRHTQRALLFGGVGVGAAVVVAGAVLYGSARRAPAPDALPSAPTLQTAASGPALPSTLAANTRPAPAATTTARPSVPIATPTPALAESAVATVSAPSMTPPPTAAPEPAPETATLERARDLFDRGRYAEAMAEAKAVQKRAPDDPRARALVENAEVEVVVDTKVREARAALKRGDKDGALEIVKAGLVVKPSDGRLLDLWKEATRE